MAKKQRKKLPKLEEIKKKIKGKVYVGDEIKKRELRIKELEKQVDSLQTENDSLKQVVKIRVK
jgi:hypothetical protein